MYKKRVTELLASLKQCSKTRDLERGRKLHADALSVGCHTNKHVAAALVNMYCKCRAISEAREIFNKITRRDVVLWTSLILGYVENEQSLVAIELFSKMDCEADSITFVAALKACANLASFRDSDRQFVLEKGMAIHRQARERGFDTDRKVANGLVDMYSKCGSMLHARGVFDKMVHRDVVLWTCLILGYVETGEDSVALELFAKMDCEPNPVTFAAALKACANAKELKKGILIHKQAREGKCDTDIIVASALVDMYSKCNSMTHAQEAFDGIKHRDVVLWSGLILGYVENGESSLAMDLFRRMDCEANAVTFSAVLRACASSGAFPDGKVIHVRICRAGLEQEQVVLNCLVDFYAKCGTVTLAEDLFNTMKIRNIISYSALMAGYSSVGDTHRVFYLAREIQESRLELDSVSFICILSSCSHAGTVEEGWKWFQSMPRYRVNQTLDHYNCVVDMLGRANRIQEALSVVNTMPYKADDVTWTTLLAACSKWKNLEVGKIAFQALVNVNPDNAAAYVMMRDTWEDLKQHKL